MTASASTNDITRTTLAVLFIGILIAASFWILRPFVTALIWAVMIVITTWPLMLSVERRLWGKRGVAVTVMTVALLLVLIIPLTLAILSLIERTDIIVGWARSATTIVGQPLPEWVVNAPLVGPKIAERWNELGTIDRAELAERIAPHARKIVNWLLLQTGSIMMMIVQFLLTVIISAVLYATGEKAGLGICLFARRLSGQSGEDAVILAGKAIRGVALGVVVTALAQTFLAGIGLAVSGVPAAALLSAIVFILCVAQVGPALVLIPSVIWLFMHGDTVWGTVMIFWSVVVGTIDNFLRPVLIKKGADLPLILIFAGVIGGLIAFGVIGLFIGPVMLAVTYTLLEAWVKQGQPAPGEASTLETPVFRNE